jgi:hypothetical protein
VFEIAKIVWSAAEQAAQGAAVADIFTLNQQ